jgi:hypothetical protein
MTHHITQLPNWESTPKLEIDLAVGNGMHGLFKKCPELRNAESQVEVLHWTEISCLLSGLNALK